MHVTVAICTWNRAKLLDQTLTQMRNLRIPEGVTWELLVVNNNSPDDTDEVIARHSTSLPIRRLFEPKQGHCNARNCAIEAATGEIMLWTDDDVLADPEWLAAYVAAAEAWPKAVLFGGPIQPWFECEPPRWVAERLDVLAPAFVIRDGIEDGTPIVVASLPWGANMAFRRCVWKEMVFDPLLGRNGKNMRGADESTVIGELLRRGYEGRWVGNARVQHFVESSRLTPSYVYRSFQGMSETSDILQYMKTSGEKRQFPRWFVRMWCEATLRKTWNAWSQNAAWFEALRTAAVAHGRLSAWWAIRKMATENQK